MWVQSNTRTIFVFSDCFYLLTKMLTLSIDIKVQSTIDCLSCSNHRKTALPSHSLEMRYWYRRKTHQDQSIRTKDSNNKCDTETETPMNHLAKMCIQHQCILHYLFVVRCCLFVFVNFSSKLLHIKRTWPTFRICLFLPSFMNVCFILLYEYLN